MPAPAAQPALAWLVGTRIQRIDAPRRGLFALTLFAHGEKPCLLLSLGEARGVGALSDRPKGEPASTLITKLRTKIENARITEIEAFPSAASATHLLFTLSRGDATLHLVADFRPRAPNLLLLDAARRVQFAMNEAALKNEGIDRKAAFAPPLGGHGVSVATSPEALFAAGAELSQSAGDEAQEHLRRDLIRAVRAERKRVSRRAEAIRGDIARAEQAPVLREHGNVVLCHLASIARGASTLTVEQDGGPLSIALDPRKSGSENANAMFERARRLERGLSIARARLAEADAELAALDARAEQLRTASPETLETERPEPRGPTPSGKARGVAPRVPYRQFDTPHGRVLVGKGAVDNDALTLTVARPHDHWLHVRGLHGAHVVVPRARGEALPPELLVDAAHLAAHFSDARGDDRVEVQHTERRYVRKGKRAAPGAVQLEREKVLLLRVEPERLQRLLKLERR